MSKFLRVLAWVLGIAAVLVGIGRLTVIRWWQVPVGDPYLEASLAPTLHGGDWVILWRGTAPAAGDLVLCPEPKAEHRVTIGRLIGETGDHLQLIGGGLLVAGRAPETERGCDPFTTRNPANGAEVTQGCREEIIAGSHHLRGDGVTGAPPPADADAQVPAGQIFLVSDNRMFPWDSRDYGLVPRDTCHETVIFRLMSKNGFFDVPNRLTLIR